MNDSSATMTAVISTTAVKRLHSGHRWIYANEFQTPVATLPVGGVVKIVSQNQKPIGFAHTNPHSLIAGRLLTYDQSVPDDKWLVERLNQAHHYRESTGFTDVCRLVYSEGDSLPGLTIDHYNRCFVVQIVTAGMEAWKDVIIDWLRKRFNPISIFLRNDTPYRNLEHLSCTNESVLGTMPERFSWIDRGVTYIADLANGQKTGSFLDQKFNRYELDEIAKDKTILDLFCYHGGFGLRAAKSGAKHVLFIDGSESALAVAEESAIANGVKNRCEFLCTDIFPWLQQTTNKYDIVVCDPPSFIKNRTSEDAGIRAYQRLNGKAMKSLQAGGILLTFSCSHLMSKVHFREVLREAARGDSWIVGKELTQSPDHPILLGHPETEYLKGAILQKCFRN